MEKIDKFFDKYKKIIPLEQEVRDVVLEEVEKLGISIPREKIKLQSGVVRCNIQPTEKTILFLHKEKILTTLEEKLGERAPKEIK